MIVNRRIRAARPPARSLRRPRRSLTTGVPEPTGPAGVLRFAVDPSSCRLSPFPRRAFSLTELVVVVAVFVILLAILVPYALRAREGANRTACADHLRQLGAALRTYAAANRGSYPRTTYDEANRPTGWTAFTRGPDANDVTASLFLLVRNGMAKPSLFGCPSTDVRPRDVVYDVTQANAPRNFDGPRSLAYGYACPFSNAAEYGVSEYLPADFAVMADLSPGRANGADATAVPVDAPPLELAKANSPNHGTAGQNVLFAAGNVEFRGTPYAGVERDNIYTAQEPNPVFSGTKPLHTKPGVLGTQYSPAWKTDSFLVPAVGLP